MSALEYRLSCPEPHTHLFDLQLRVPDVSGPLELVMPSWTPGSYLLREFPRNVQDFAAFDASDAPLPWSKTDKNTWRIEAGSGGPVVARYRVYANELTVRTSHLDASHGYVNGASVFMYPRGREAAPVSLEVQAPASWGTATSLRETAPQRFAARDYDELVDCPLEIGTHREFGWEQRSVAHRFAVWGADAIDEHRWIADAQRIVEACAALFGGLPYDRYLFIVHVVPGGRGGLEHATSASLQVAPAWLAGNDYESLLLLLAHEFFHVWLGKRIRPAPLGRFDYTAENYTRNLWVVEGFTTYYADLILRRAGLMTARRYLDRLGESIERLRSTPGRRLQSLEESSFDAWIRFYRPDAHTPNSQVSYYQKGSLVALALDLEIRRGSGRARSLDDVTRLLWERYGARNLGFPEDTAEGIQAVAEEVHGASLGELFDAYVRGTAEIDFDRHLAAAGLELVAGAAHAGVASGGFGGVSAPEGVLAAPGAARHAGSHERRLGVRLREESGRLRVTHVLADSPAHAAGVNAGDEIVAVDGTRATSTRLSACLDELPGTGPLTLLVVRRERLLELRPRLGPPSDPPAVVLPMRRADPEALRLRRDWLGLEETSGS